MARYTMCNESWFRIILDTDAPYRSAAGIRTDV
jgi:hypothetical protein